MEIERKEFLGLLDRMLKLVDIIEKNVLMIGDQAIKISELETKVNLLMEDSHAHRP